MFPGAPAAVVMRAAFLLFRGDDVVTKTMHVATLMLAVAMLVGCSREKIDWKSAEAADTVEAYDHFLERHPDGELSTQARARVAQLDEDRDWKRASAADTADGYRHFLAQHENGKWAGEARIRVENFALDGTSLGPMRPTDPEPTVSAATTAPEPNPGTFGPRADTQPAAVAAASAATSPVPAPVATRPALTPPTQASAKPIPGTHTTQFGIQLGAFSSQQAALNDWKRIQGRFGSDLHGLFAKAVPVQQASGQLFRLQASVGEETKARTICASLAKQSQPCVVVLPQSH
jgi:cell division septation protein DedD